MHLRCPHCQNPIEVVDLPAAGEISCTSCGSNFRLDQMATTGWDDFAGKRIGKFEVIGTLGRGAFGIVLKARDDELDRTVAIKIPRPGNVGEGRDLDRFIREARSVAQLRHPSIVTIHEVGQTPLPSPGTPGQGPGVRGIPYLVSDLVDGVTLADLLTARRPSLPESAKLIADVAEALDHAHRHGVVHRDVKPSNIMVRPDGSPCVMDFGLAKRDAGEITMTIDGQVLGTPAYMSPEQAKGEGHKVDGKSDVYSLGVILYQLLTGELPFRGNTNMLLHQVLHEEPQPPRRLNDKIPRDLETICVKCMQKEPRKRYASAKDLADDLHRFLQGRPILARPVGRLEKTWRWARRNPAVAVSSGLTILALLALMAGSLWYVQQEARRSTEAALRQGEAARKQALAEQGIQLALDQAQEARASLQAILKKPGGVFELLNHPENWEAQIQLAKAALDRAIALLAETSEPEASATASAWPELRTKANTLRTQLAEDDKDRVLAVRLDKIRMDKALMLEGKFDFRKAAAQYPKAFADADPAIMKGKAAEVAARIAASPIKEQLVAALDDWAHLAFWLEKDEDLAERVLAVARLAAPDPEWGDRLRQLDLWRNPEALAELVKDGPPAGLSPNVLALVGDMLRAGTHQESWLRQAQARYPGDLWLNYGLANALEPKNPAEAAGFYWVAVALRPKLSPAYNNLGIALADQKKLPEAIAAFRKAIEVDPRDAIAYANLGNALHVQKKLAEAVAAYQSAIEFESKFAGAYYGLGNALRDQQKLPEATVAYHKAVEFDPKLAGAYTNLGDVLRDQKKLPEAIAACEKAIELDPKLAAAYLNLGNALADQKKLPEAIAAFHKAIELDPKDAKGYVNLGSALSDQKKLPEAIAAYHKAIELDPKLAVAYNNLGKAFREQKKLPEAIAAFHKAIELDAKSGMAYTNLGVALADQKKLPEAIAAYRKAIALDPKYAMAYYSLGLGLVEQKKLPEAIAAFQKAIEFDPEHADTYLSLGSAFYHQQQLPEAIAAYHKAIEADPKLAKAYYSLGNILREQKKAPEAIAAYHKAIEFDPEYVEAHCNLGIALRDQKMLPEAIAAFNKAIEVAPKFAPSYLNLGVALFDQQKLSEAIAAIHKAIELDPKLADAHYAIGNALRDQRKLPEAVAAFQKAIELDPKKSEAYVNLGNVFRSQRKLPQAVASYHKAIEINPNFAIAYNALGIALREQRKLPEAWAALRKAIKLDPNYPEAHNNLATVLADQQKLPEAVAAYRKAIELKPKYATAQYGLGNALRDQGKLPEAVAAFHKTIELNPNYAEAHCNLGHIFQGQGEFSKALAELKVGHELGSARPGWPYASAAWVKQCEQLLALDKRIEPVLEGKAEATAADLLAMAYLCRNYKKRHATAADLFGKAFKDSPAVANDVGPAHRYSAARTAALAGLGVGDEAAKLTAEQKATRREQARHWLTADLDSHIEQVKKAELQPVMLTIGRLAYWQNDAELSGLRDAKALAALPAEEREAWQKLWIGVAQTLKDAQGQFKQTREEGKLSDKNRSRVHEVKMLAGRTYVIDLESPEFDTLLILQNAAGDKLAENDDIAPDNLNSRIIFTAKEAGAYRIVVTSFQQRGVGTYAVTIREFVGKEK